MLSLLTFEEYLERSEQYFAVVREAGDLPWFLDPDRAAKVAARLGLPTDTEPMALRRALWDRAHNPPPEENQP